jgi:hypothetical protein
MTIDTSAAHAFVHAEGRLLDRFVLAARADGGDPGPVVAALVAYRNGDGGFGHGLEPDKRCPASQPLDVQVALETLLAAGAAEPDLVAGACDFLAGVAAPDGAVPVLLPSIAGFPRAAHWAATDDYPPDLLPTAGIVGAARALGGDHRWLDRAEAWCLATLEDDGAPAEAHALLCAARLLEHAGDRRRAAALVDAVAAAIPASPMVQMAPDPDAYGVTPLQFAPRPDSLLRPSFADDVIDAHLDSLERQQQPDGGWPIQWDPPSQASLCEWRAIRTVEALALLVAYGRLPD